MHTSTDGRLGRFHFLAVVNKAAVNNCTNISLSPRLQFSGDIPRSGVAESSGSPIFFFFFSSMFNCLRRHCTVWVKHQPLKEPQELHGEKMMKAHGRWKGRGQG